MNARLLGILGGVAVAAIVILYLFVKNAAGPGASDPTEAAPKPTTASGETTAPQPPRTAANGGASVGEGTPRLPPAPAGSDLGSGQNPKDYMIGDVRVRDHRSGDNKPLDLPPNAHPAQSRELPSTLTHDISQQVKKVMYACAADLPKEARGTKPRLDGQLTVAIKGKTLSLTNIVAQVRDVEGPSADALKQCVEQKSAGLTSAANDQADISEYGIAITFAIP